MQPRRSLQERLRRWRLVFLFCCCWHSLTPAPAPAEDGAAAQKDAKDAGSAGVRNVIIMIGDGMGPQEVGLLTLYAKLAANSEVPDRTTAIEHVLNEGVVGIMRTEAHGA